MTTLLRHNMMVKLLFFNVMAICLRSASASALLLTDPTPATDKYKCASDLPQAPKINLLSSRVCVCVVWVLWWMTLHANVALNNIWNRTFQCNLLRACASYETACVQARYNVLLFRLKFKYATHICCLRAQTLWFAIFSMCVCV